MSRTNGPDVVAIDPSINRSGVAMFRDGALVMARYIAMPDDGNILERASRMAQAIAFNVKGVVDEQAVLVFEWPHVYDGRQAGKTKGQDPNDLLGLAAVGGALAPAFQSVELVEPRAWKGQVPKPKRKADPYIIHKRVEKRLRPDELIIVQDIPGSEWDVWDAIGIGLHHLGRFGQSRGGRLLQ